MKEIFNQTLNHQTHLPNVVGKNISELLERQKRREKKLGSFHRIVNKATMLAGTTTFLALNLIWFVFWVIYNSEVVPNLKPFDPFPFGFLTFAVSLEAIVLSIMVLMVQNQIQVDADRRAELDLLVNLLDERETTLILKKISRVENALNISVEEDEVKMVKEYIAETHPKDIEINLLLLIYCEVRLGYEIELENERLKFHRIL